MEMILIVINLLTVVFIKMVFAQVAPLHLLLEEIIHVILKVVYNIMPMVVQNVLILTFNLQTEFVDYLFVLIFSIINVKIV